jgi:hypothetical protein
MPEQPTSSCAMSRTSGHSVGAFHEDSSATGIGGDQMSNDINNAGAVYMFVRDDQSSWSQQAYIKALNPGADDEFGWTVMLSGDGNTLAVGGHREDSGATGVTGNRFDNSAEKAGAVYLY